jgi:hypothetical protein
MTQEQSKTPPINTPPIPSDTDVVGTVRSKRSDASSREDLYR